jgi:hypothetical protein
MPVADLRSMRDGRTHGLDDNADRHALKLWQNVVPEIHIFSVTRYPRTTIAASRSAPTEAPKPESCSCIHNEKSFRHVANFGEAVIASLFSIGSGRRTK